MLLESESNVIEFNIEDLNTKECVCACVRASVRAYGWVGVWVCVCAHLDLSFCLVDFNRTGLIVFVFLCDCGSKICFLIGPMRLGFISNFRFSQNLFLIFLMIGSRYLNRVDSIRKRIKIPIFSKQKKKFLAITVLVLLTKTCFFFKAYKLPNWMNNSFEKNHDNGDYK